MKIIPFEQFGGVGDGDIHTGAGTDNANAFDLAVKAGESGDSVEFAKGKQYKTTRQIPIHNMIWKGDMADPPVIFGWFTSRGKRIIGRSREQEMKKASISGLRFHRCGPHAEHGILIDNMAAFDFDGWITASAAADGEIRGGAIGVSAFQPNNRPSKNVTVKARLSNSANFGVQYGNVSDGSIQVIAENCVREVIGIEPYCLGCKDFTAAQVDSDSIQLIGHGLATAHPLIYARMDAKEGVEGLPHANYWFVIVVDSDHIRLASSKEDAIAGKAAQLGRVPLGTHRLFTCGVTKNITIHDSIINNLNPPTESWARGLDGVVVFTATSGGYVENIEIKNVKIRDFANRAPGYCVSWLGLWDLDITGFELYGGRIGGVRVGKGTLNGLRNSSGELITPKTPTVVTPRGGSVRGNVIRDFPRYGISVLAGTAVVRDNRGSSAAKGSVGFDSLRSQGSQLATEQGGNNFTVPNGLPYRARVLKNPR